MITVKEIENEARAVSKLCQRAAHKNLVTVLRHGMLDPTHYFIDMELCDFTLETYIIRELTPMDMGWVDPSFIMLLTPNARMKQIWDIMKDITNGAAFIHDHGEVHRDLKPCNSVTYFFET
jgi:serine/threonine protein kinase